MKTLLTTTALALMLGTGAASAASWDQPTAYGRVPAAGSSRPAAAHVARPRMSYGTGYHGRTSATGGPVGGLPSRN